MSTQQIRLSLVAPSGSGKSTLAAMLQRLFEEHGYTVEVLKLAQPLYDIQASLYAKALVEVAAGKQDQRLLEVIATEMRRIDARALVNNFQQRLARCQARVVINDDLRDDQVDWPHLKEQQFQVVRVVTSDENRARNLSMRKDLSVVKNSSLNKQIASIRADFVLVNNGPLAQLEVQARGLLAHFLRAIREDADAAA